MNAVLIPKNNKLKPTIIETNAFENIGNKMLLYGDDNSSASNEDLSSKRNVYRNGKKNQTGGTPEETFQMVKEFLANEDFKDQFLHTEVEKRAKLLAKDAISIWS